MEQQAQSAQPRQPAAALLRPPSRAQASSRHGARQAPRDVPVEAEDFRAVEPDGTEDPWASADDGVVPDRPAEAVRERRQD